MVDVYAKEKIEDQLWQSCTLQRAVLTVQFLVDFSGGGSLEGDCLRLQKLILKNF